MFQPQIEHFNGKYNLITWDAPCHGKSRPYDIFSFDDTSETILEILKQLNVEKIIAIGQSLGGYYAQAFILRYPEKVKGFVGIGTTPYGEKYYSAMDKFWLRQVEWMAMCFPLEMMKKASAKQAACTEAGVKNMMDMLKPYGKREYCHLMQIAYDEFLKDNCDLNIHCPVLLTYGEKDKVGKVQVYNKMWADETGLPLKVVENAGHNANVDNPAEMNHIIEEWLSKNFDKHIL